MNISKPPLTEGKSKIKKENTLEWVFNGLQKKQDPLNDLKEVFKDASKESKE